MTSFFQPRTSSRIVRAVARKPWPVISDDVLYPIRRSAPLIVFSLIARSWSRSPLNTRPAGPVSWCSSRNTATACWGRNTRCGSPFFFRLPFFSSSQAESSKGRRRDQSLTNGQNAVLLGATTALELAGGRPAPRKYRYIHQYIAEAPLIHVGR
jgi:hypothetical protein